MAMGIVYILTNPSFDGWVKIGMSARNDIEARLAELNRPTNLPLSYRAYAIYFAKLIPNSEIAAQDYNISVRTYAGGGKSQEILVSSTNRFHCKTEAKEMERGLH